jgi:transcriptional regulator with XRE-family HTH domain
MQSDKRKVMLKVLRVANNKKQSDIAEAVSLRGVVKASQRKISEYETGLYVPSIEAAIELAIAYEVPLTTLIKSLGFDLSDVPKEVPD